MLRATLIGHQVIQVREPREKHLLAPIWMMEPFHREEFPRNGVMGLIQQRAGHGHLWVFEDRLPARFLGLEPLPYALAVGHPRRGGNVIDKAAEPLAQCKHPQASPLSRPGQQGVKLRA